MGKAALFLATGFEEIEAVSTIDVLRRGGIDLNIVSVSGMDFVEGAHNIAVKSDALFFSIDYDEYDLLILPGGMPGAENLRKHEGLCELLVKANDEGKTIAAICAAPYVLGELGILKGKQATCFPGYESSLEGAEVLEQDIVKDGNIITGRGAGVAVAFGLEILKLSKTEEDVRSLADKMIYHWL